MSIRDSVLTWRDRLLTNRRFLRWATSFPMTRPIARGNARALFDLCAGFVYSQVLLACVRLNLFDALAEAPMSGSELARKIGLPEEATERLLRAAVSLKLADRRDGGRFGLGALGATLLANPSLVAMVEHHSDLYADLHDPVELLRSANGSCAVARYWPYARCENPRALPAASVVNYTTLMAATQEMISTQILDAVSFDRFDCVMDLGGGDGAFVEAAAVRNPKQKFILFDLPPVVERARIRLSEASFGDRIRIVGGDFFRDALPAGAEALTLIRVVHDHDDAKALQLLGTARRSLSGGGSLILAEPLAGCAGAEPIGDAYFAFYLTAMGSGRPRTREELFRMIEAAGFVRPRLIRTDLPVLVQVVEATVPATN